MLTEEGMKNVCVCDTERLLVNHRKIYKCYLHLEMNFSGGMGAAREVFLDMKHGVEAKNYADVSS